MKEPFVSKYTQIGLVVSVKKNCYHFYIEIYLQLQLAMFEIDKKKLNKLGKESPRDKFIEQSVFDKKIVLCVPCIREKPTLRPPSWRRSFLTDQNNLKNLWRWPCKYHKFGPNYFLIDTVISDTMIHFLNFTIYV